MESKRTNSSKMKNFFKKNMYYLIMALCLIAVATMITITILNKNKDIIEVPIVDEPIIETPVVVEPEPVIVEPEPIVPDPPVIVPVVLASPVASVDIILDYTIDSLVWHSTLKHYAVHQGIDFGGEDGDNVTSVYAGTVKSIDYDVLNGYTVTIAHSDKLYSIYSSLNEPIVAQGQSVAKGTVIGTMGNTATNEYNEGPHLHFCVYENGVLINPYTYLDIGDK